MGKSDGKEVTNMIKLKFNPGHQRRHLVLLRETSDNVSWKPDGLD